MKTEKPRKESILEDMKKNLVAQREANEAIFEAKRKRVAIEHTINTIRAHKKVIVTNLRGPDGKPQYGSDPKIDARADELLDEDDDYRMAIEIKQKIEEEIFTAKLDLSYLEGEWKILLVEAALIDDDSGIMSVKV